jgi:hypothetical protein
MKTKILFIAFIFLLYCVSLVKHAFAQSNQEERQVANFTKVEIVGHFEVVILPDGNEKLVLTGEEERLKNVITEVVGSRLVIRYDRENRWWRNENNRNKIRVQLSVKQLEYISAAASADVVVKDTLKADRMRIEASSAGSIKVNVTANELIADCSSGADIRLSGNTNRFSAEASSGADIKAEELTAAICNLVASSGADISITVTDEIQATASSGSDIRYRGNPARVKVRSSSGGDVRGKN